jgi:uncharacterized membrane protein
LYFFSLLVLPATYLYLKEPKESILAQRSDEVIKSPPIIWVVFFNMMLMWVMFFIIPVQIPFYLKTIGVEKNALIGIAIASTTLFSAISSFSFSNIKDKLSFQQIFGTHLWSSKSDCIT